MTNKSSASNNQFNKLIAALGIDLELTGEEIADIIWFSLKRQESSSTPNDTTSEPENQSNPTPTNHSEKLNPTSTTPSKNLNPTPTNPQTSPKLPSAQIHPQTLEKTQISSKTKALPLAVPDAPSLREPLALALVLKPLMRRVESGRKTVLDETVTAERTAAEGICIPILKPEPEPWLDVALVVDESKSMLIWRHTIWELKRLLEHYGVFRDVRAWGLVTDENEQIHIRPGIGKNSRQQRLASHREILDPNRRRLILLVSDCVAAIWRNGALTQVLKDWTNTQPVAIIQMLPDWLWLKTGLGLGASVSLGSLTPGVANKHLLVKKLLLWKDINLETGIKIPVFTLEPDTALPWSQMVVGKSDAVASGFVLSSEIKVNRSKQQSQTTTPQVNPQERVYRFRMTASAMGRKLAGLLAAAPVINLPVVRLIQKTLLSESRQVHVAEVFLGGLLKPLTPIQADTLPDTVQYDFIDDEIRGMLLEAAPVKDSADIFDAVSQYVAAELGKSLQDFVALLKAPEEDDNERVKPFAEVAVKILKQLGGEYARFAEQLNVVNITNALGAKTYSLDVMTPEQAKIERKIQAAAEEWENQRKSTDYLFKGSQLAQAEKLIEDDINTVVLSSLALEFIQASQQERDRQEKEMREQKLSTISILTTSSQELFNSNKEFDALLASLNAAKEMKQAAFDIPSDLRFRVKVALQQAIDWVKERNCLEGHKGRVFSVSYSPDGKTLASASGDQTIKLWDVTTCKEIRSLTGHNNEVNVVNFSPDGKTLVSASLVQRTVKLWDITTSKEIFTFSGYKADGLGSNGVSFSPDGQLLAFACEKGDTIEVWDVATRQQIASLSGHRDMVNGVSFSPDGLLLASASFDGTVKLWDVTTRKEIPTKIDYRLFLNGVSFSPNGQLLAVGGDVGTVKLWDVTTRKEIPTNFYGFEGRVTNLSFSPDGKVLVASGLNNAIKLWDVATGIEMYTLIGHIDQVNNVKFSPDGQWLVSASSDYRMKLWYVGQRQEIKTLFGHIYKVSGVAFSPNGQLLASGSHDGTVKLWDVVKGQEIKTLFGHESWWVSSVSFSPDGTYLASGSWEGTVKLWDVAIGQEIKTLSGHQGWVMSVSFSPDGTYLASGSYDDTVKLWDVATRKEISTLSGHKGAITAVSFSPNGRLLASASHDQTIKLWDVTIHKELATLTGHKVVVNSVSFSSDGRLLASASDDHTIILWDVVTHKQINIFNAKTKVNSISFSPDGQLLASGCESGTVILWNLEALSNLTLEELMARGCDWVCSYLQTNPNVSNSDKQLCDGISTAK